MPHDLGACWSNMTQVMCLSQRCDHSSFLYFVKVCRRSTEATTTVFQSGSGQDSVAPLDLVVPEINVLHDPVSAKLYLSSRRPHMWLNKYFMYREIYLSHCKLHCSQTVQIITPPPPCQRVFLRHAFKFKRREDQTWKWLPRLLLYEVYLIIIIIIFKTIEEERWP